MMRVRDEASTNAEKSEGFDLQMGGISIRLIKNQTSQPTSTQINNLKAYKNTNISVPEDTSGDLGIKIYVILYKYI